MYTIMKEWRTMKMNKDDIASKMISFIEEAEKNLQASKMSNDQKTVKNDIVNNILEKLEKETTNEN